MSDRTWGRIGGAVVGAVVGFYSGGGYAGAVLGAYSGYVAADAAFKKTTFVEPQLQDNRVPEGDYGAPIPIGYGVYKITNTALIWGRDLIQFPVETSGGGKGGGGGGATTTVEWATVAQFAVKLCKGPIVGVSRLWLDTHLVLDLRNDSDGAISPNFLGAFADDDYVKYNIEGGEVWIYRGTETQVPNPIIEEREGENFVNANRGDAYIVFYNIDVNRFGKRFPVVSAEVVESGNDVDEISDNIALELATGTGTQYFQFPFGTHYADGRFYALSFVRSTTSGGFSQVGGIVVQALDPVTHATFWTTSVLDAGVFDGIHSAIDIENGLLWMQTQTSLFAVTLSTGSIRLSVTFATFVVPMGWGGLAIVSATDQIWIARRANMYVLNRSALLSGATVASATVLTKTLADNFYNIIYCPEVARVVAYTSGSNVYVYDLNGTEIANWSASVSVLGLTPATRWSSYYQKIVGLNLTAGPAFDIAMLDVSTGAASVILANDVLTPSYAFGINEVSGNIVYCEHTSSPTNPLVFNIIDNTFSQIASFQITDRSHGIPLDMAFAYDYSVIGIKMGASQSYYIASIDKLAFATEGLNDIVGNVAQLVGIPVDDIAVADIGVNSINGYVVDSRTQARAAIEPLKRIGFFDLVHEDGKIKARKFGGASVMTINYQDLIMPEDGENKRPYTIRRIDEIDLPQSIEVAYSDQEFDYETQIQTASRITKRSKSKAIVTIPAAITADQAKRSGEVALYQAWASRTTWTLNASRKHWALNAGDPFTFVDELGVSRRLLCVKRELLGMTRMTIEAIEDDAAIYTNAASGATPTWVPPVIAATTTKQLALLDIPILRDSDNFAGFYAIADSSAPSAVLYESVDGGITYNSLGALQEASTGYTTTTLANFTGGNVWDDVSTVTVRLYSGTLESVTDAQVLAGLNAALIGNEIIQYATATLVSPSTYTLSRLLRGRKGTEWAIGLHSSGERFVPFSAGLTRINSSVRGALRYYKAVRSGAFITDAPVVAFTNSQAGMKPYSPVNIAGARDGSNNLTITWARRSRIGTAWGVTDALPLDDTVESYQVDIMSGSIVKRTISSTSPTCSYSAADQTTDFGGVQLSLLVNVYQMSTIVGRGTVGVKTI